MAKAFDIGVTAWSPLASGLLTGKYNTSETASEAKRLNSPEWGKINERDLKIADEVSKIAAEIGKPASQVALNWLIQQPTEVIPIVGSRQLSQLQENLACLEFQLTPEQMQQLDQVSAIELGFPHDFLKSSTMQDLAFGGGLAKIDRLL
jgi:aryl-alcohol dehydrogenase-like predicted oxidoreductase